MLVRSFSSLLVLACALGLSACSLVNAPDDIRPGTGGEGTGATGGGGGGGGAPPMCTLPAECADLTTECATGDCVQGSCVATPQPMGTNCGPAVGSTCDLQDVCDGAGVCTANNLSDGTYCSDCAAGAGLCTACQAGACNDCPTRATAKTFRSPFSAQGWTLTGGWAVYAETPPLPQFGFGQPSCSNGIDDDGDTLIDFPDDPSCFAAMDQENGFPDCSDTFDNDSDGLIDFPNDPDCLDPQDDRESPTAPIAFDHPVLGSDGNRQQPYSWGLSEQETSTATSPATRIPATLDFLSWNVDEGSDFDLKAVQVSLDGASFTTVAICPQGAATPYAFCTPSAFPYTRAADAWDVVSLAVPPAFVDQVGFVRFVYDTTDGCCDFERGWFIDALNFATDCACAAGTDCAFLDSGCASGTCDAPTSECRPAAENPGQSCAAVGTADCGTSTCDANGLCSAGDAGSFEGLGCGDCPGGAGVCWFCQAASCVDCPDVQRFAYSPPDFFNAAKWTFNGDWSIDSCIEQNTVTPTQTLCFQGMFGSTDPHVPPMLGNNGSRAFNPSPPTIVSEIEAASFFTPPTLIPANLTFRSWHQDRGGNDTFNLRDKKAIRVSTDGGTIWQPVLDCDGNTTIAFCQPWPAFTNRAENVWDDISLPMGNLAGQTGIFEFFYDTVDAGQGWERGWYLDDMNIARCD